MPTNTSVVTEFILVGFSRLTSLQGLLFSFFLTVYLLTMAGNLLIVVLVSADAALRTPMYFFLRNLSTLEIGYTSVTVPCCFTTSSPVSAASLALVVLSRCSSFSFSVPQSVASWQPWPMTATPPYANPFATHCC